MPQMMAPVPITEFWSRPTSSQICAVARLEKCVCMTALGSPVVPDV